MPPRTPDGEYPFTIEIRDLGENDMACIVKENIYILGDIFRDMNIKRSSN